MSEKILIASDSTTDLSPELRERYGVKLIPLGVSLGENNYKDGVDVNPDMIYDFYAKTGQLPKTNAANLSECADFFKKYTDEGYSVVFITISSEMSSTFNNARMAAEDFENVYVVDGKNLSTGGGLLVLAACDMAAQGMSAKDIAARCAGLTDYVDASFVIDSLEFLHKGGRCSAVAAFGANLLKLKPCIMVRGGKMGVGKKYRGKFADVLNTYIEDMVGDASDIDQTRIFVTHAGCDEKIIKSCVDQVKKAAPFKEVLITRAGCTISSHCGRDTLGVLFIRKNPVK